MFVYAISAGIASRDPAAVVTKALKPKPKSKKQPAVTDLTELQDLLKKSEASGAYPITLLASRLLALTVARPGAVRGVQWTEIQGVDWESDEICPDAMWIVPAERMKLLLDRKDEAVFDHFIPLAPAAVETLRAARVLSGRGKLVFPGQRHAHKPLSENAIGYLYNRVGWHGRHVPHGWRSSFSTIMNERCERHWRESGHEGASPDRAIIDLMLAHIPEGASGSEGAYNRAAYMPRRRELAEEWAALLLKYLQPAGNLLSVKRRQQD